MADAPTPPATTQTATVNPAVIVHFVNSVREVFTTMVGVATTVLKPHLKTEPAPQYDVSSIIGFSGEITGSVVVSFQTEAAVAIVKAFSGVDISPDSPDFPDAIGELANMIAGSAKKDLGAAASISTPSVVIGRGHKIARLHDVPCVVIPVSTPMGSFAVEINIKTLKKSV